jgi:micrococcal nuclease
MSKLQVYRRCFVLPAALLLCLAQARAADEQRAVVKVYSGNVIKLQAQTAKDKDSKVRYIGVDAPSRGEPFFDICRTANKALVENKKVMVHSDVVKTDADGRLLIYLYAENVFVNAELIKNGYGLVAAPDGNVQHREFFLSLQQEARKNRQGVWAFEDQSDEPYYVGSKRKKIFHRPSCPHVKDLEFDDRLIFRTKGEALTGNYSQDWRCCPLFLKPDKPIQSAEENQTPSSPVKR